MNHLWTTAAALLLALALALTSANTAQRNVTIHPFTEENIERTETGYLIRDNGSGVAYLFDADTALTPAFEGDIPGYEEGEAALVWFERYLSLPIESGLGFGMGDLFDVIVTGRHIDALLGVYWWD